MKSRVLVGILFAGTSLSAAVVTPAFAQATGGAGAEEQENAVVDPDEEGAEESSDFIVVSGIRSSLRSAVQQKRDADNVVDAITAEDIGRFPTENVADAAQRITGVQIDRTRGSGSQASIRGLPSTFTRVQLNGSTLSSALVDAGGGGAGGVSRSFDFRLLPTEFVRSVSVTKSPTADLQEGGLSGTINVETVRPLDLGRTMFTASGFAVRNSNSGETTPRVSALASSTFLDGRLGLLFTGGYDEAQTETHRIESNIWSTLAETATRDYNNDGDRLDTFNLPGQIRTEIFAEQRKRLTLASILEFEATDNLTLYAEGFYGRFDIKVNDYQNLHILANATGGIFDPSTTAFIPDPGVDSSQLTSGYPFITRIGLANTDVRGFNRIQDALATTYYTKGGAQWEADEWSADLSFVRSSSEQNGSFLGLAQIARFNVTVDCPPGEQLCGISFPAASEALYLDPTRPIVASLNGSFERQITDDVSELAFNVHREFDSGIITAISAGGVASWRDIYSDAPTLVVTATGLAPLLGLQRSTVTPSGFSTMPYQEIVSVGAGSFAGQYSGSLTFPTQWVSADTQRVLDALSRDQLLAAGTLSLNQSSIVDVGEDILAAYVRADFGDADDLLSGNFGLRVVRTSATATGFAPDFTGIRVLVDAGGTITVPPAAPIVAKNSYTEFLPSFNARMNVTDDVILRFAGSRTMSRPNLTQISPSTTVTGGAGNFVINAGNPNLEPFISLNLDFSAEWYPDPDTAITLAVFSKDVATLVRPNTSEVFYPVTFVTASTNTTEVRNQVFLNNMPTNQEGVTLRGAEIGYQQYFSFLPGPLANTGVLANYTFISNSDPQVLTAASKHNFNVSAFYEDGGLALRASYTWRDKFVSLGLPDGNNGLGITTMSRGNLDLNVTYDVTEWFSVVFQGSNVLNDVDIDRTTLGNLPDSYTDPGVQYMLGARVRF